jgi:hypothetical protein
MPWKLNGKIIKEGRSWVDASGITHPPQWSRWPDSEKTAAGLTWEDPPAADAPIDNRFYAGKQDDGTLIEHTLVDINHTWTQEEIDRGEPGTDGTPADPHPNAGDAKLDEDGNQIVTVGLKTQAIAQAKQTAKEKLAETDWMIIKSVEDSSFTVPQSVLTYRAAVRTASNTIENAVTNAADHAAYRALYDATTDDDGNQVAAPINTWPDEVT